MNILKFTLLFVVLSLFTACASVPEEMRYQQPGLPLGSSSIQGILKDNKGFLSVDETLVILTVDGKYVDGYDGAYWKDKIAIYPGNRVVEVLYSYPEFLVGITRLSFNANQFTEYQFKFEYPFVPSPEDIEEFNRINGVNLDGVSLWARVWVENVSTGVSQSHTLMQLSTVTTIPIVL